MRYGDKNRSEIIPIAQPWNVNIWILKYSLPQKGNPNANVCNLIGNHHASCATNETKGKSERRNCRWEKVPQAYCRHNVKVVPHKDIESDFRTSHEKSDAQVIFTGAGYVAQKVIFGLWKHCFQKAHRKSKTIFRILGFSNFYTWRFSISSSCSWPSFLSFASFSGINHSQLGPFEEMSDVDEWTTS